MDLLSQIDAQTWLFIITAVVGLIGWEWKKLMNGAKANRDLADTIKGLEQQMNTLHADHQQLLAKQASEHADIMRGMTAAMTDLHHGIRDLTHYIKWLGEQQTGQTPPPNINANRN